MTAAQLKQLFAVAIKSVPGGPTTKTRGADLRNVLNALVDWANISATANQYGTHPAFANALEGLIWLTQRPAGSGGGGGTPTPFTASVDSQRQATLTPETGSAATDYEYQSRPVGGVSASREIDISSMLAPGETASDYEYQVR